MKCYSCGAIIDPFSDDISRLVMYAMRVSNVPGRQYEGVLMCSMECSRELEGVVYGNNSNHSA